MKYLILLLPLLLLVFTSCETKEDPKKIEMLQVAKQQVLEACKRELHISERSTQFSDNGRFFFNLSLRLDSIIRASIHNIKDSTSANELDKQYHLILSDPALFLRKNRYLEPDSIAIYSTHFRFIQFNDNQDTTNQLINQIKILNDHLKVLRMNASGTSHHPGIIPGFGNTQVCESSDSTKIILSYYVNNKDLFINNLKLIGLFSQESKKIEHLKPIYLPERTLIIKTKKLPKGRYYAKMECEVIHPNGELKKEDAYLPLTIW